jgi:uncharacterized protein YutE (UPF0331/DUF86 family)
MCWAHLEAISRAIHPKDFSRPQTPGRIVERLAEHGDIEPNQAEFLRSAAQKRNRFIHGELSTAVDTKEISTFIAILDQLLTSTRTRSIR